MNDKHMTVLVDIQKKVAKVEEHLRHMNGTIKDMNDDIDDNTGFRNYMKGVVAGLGLLSIAATILGILAYFS